MKEAAIALVLHNQWSDDDAVISLFRIIIFDEGGGGHSKPRDERPLRGG